MQSFALQAGNYHNSRLGYECSLAWLQVDVVDHAFDKTRIVGPETDLKPN